MRKPDGMCCFRLSVACSHSWPCCCVVVMWRGARLLVDRVTVLCAHYAWTGMHGRDMTVCVCVYVYVYTLQAGGFEALGRLYDDPDALSEILPSDKLKMVARAMIEVRVCVCVCVYTVQPRVAPMRTDAACTKAGLAWEGMSA